MELPQSHLLSQLQGGGQVLPVQDVVRVLLIYNESPYVFAQECIIKAPNYNGLSG